MVGHTSDLFFVYRQRSAEPIDRESFKYGTGDVTPRPLGGSGFGACYEAGKKSFCDSLVTPQQEFRYGSGSVAPKLLGGSGRGMEYDQVMIEAKANAAQKGQRGGDSFRFGSGSVAPKPLGGI